VILDVTNGAPSSDFCFDHDSLLKFSSGDRFQLLPNGIRIETATCWGVNGVDGFRTCEDSVDFLIEFCAQI